MLKIAVTGPVGAGKSTVMALLADSGFEVLIADDLVAQQRVPGEAGFQAIVEKFGSEILDSGGHIDTAKLRALVMGSETALRTLEGIIHPLVRGDILTAIAQLDKDALLAIELPLLKSGDPYLEMVDSVLLVRSDDNLVDERVLLERGLTPDTINQIRSAQPSIQDFEAIADKVITNDSTVDDLRAAVVDYVNYLTISS